MATGKFLKTIIFTLLALLLPLQISAQKSVSITLQNAVDLALQKNHLLNVKKYQVEEKRQKVNEDRIKFLPVVSVGASYQYNTNLPSLKVTRGQFGELPLGSVVIPLPSVDEVLSFGTHDNYNAGVTLYQPVSQLGKINAGVNVSRTEMQITQAEETKAERQVRQLVEKLYYGLLISQKQVEEAEIRIELAESRLKDVESAHAAGKTTESSKYGLAASVAEEQQNLLKVQIQYDDYASDLKQIAGIDPDSELIPEPVSSDALVVPAASVDTSLSMAASGNSELKIAALVSSKAGYSVKASQFSYLPDIGLMGGYAYQKGTLIYPKNNAFIGASLKWNLQDLLTNHTVQMQRSFAKREADENLANTKEQVSKDIAKAYRKLKQSEELLNVAEKALTYRKEDLKIQTDRHNSGLNLTTDLLIAKAAKAKAEADYFSAQINHKIALSDLQVLTGNY